MGTLFSEVHRAPRWDGPVLPFMFCCGCCEILNNFFFNKGPCSFIFVLDPASDVDSPAQNHRMFGLKGL